MNLRITRRLLIAAALCSIGSAQTVSESYRIANPAPDPFGNTFGWSIATDGGRSIISNLDRSTWIIDTATGTPLLELPNPNANDPSDIVYYGWDVALDGDLAIVGAPYLDTNPISTVITDDIGGAWLMDSATGQIIDFLSGSVPIANDNQGKAVALHKDYILIGSPRIDVSFFEGDRGAVHIFDRVTRQELEILQPFDVEDNDNFASDIAVEGNLMLVGAPGDDSERGSVYVYDLSSPGFPFLRKLTALDRQPGDRFGEVVSLSGDRAVIGAPADSFNGVARAGSAYVFEVSTAQQLRKLTAPSPSEDSLFGNAVALSGEVAVVGAPFSGPNFQGAAFEFNAATGALVGRLASSAPQASACFGLAVATDGVQSLITETGYPVGNTPFDGAVCAFGFPEIGTNYCAAAVNSTGVAAALGATGSSSVAANDLMLEGVGLPTNAFGFFLTSRSQGFVQNPGGSQGNFCLGGAIGRYIGPGQIQSSGPLGRISLVIDNTQVPQPSGAVSVQPGETWNFQLWHRDSVGGSVTSNFTDGYEIVFE